MLNDSWKYGLLGRVTTLVWNPLPEYRTERDGNIDAVETVFRSGPLILGDSERGFEEEYATYHGVPQCVGVDDEVITVSNTAGPRAALIRSFDAEFGSLHPIVVRPVPRHSRRQLDHSGPRCQPRRELSGSSVPLAPRAPAHRVAAAQPHLVVQARTLIACLQAMVTCPPAVEPG